MSAKKKVGQKKPDTIRSVIGEKISDSLVPATLALAEGILAMVPCPGDRPYSSLHAAKLRIQMLAGKFHEMTWIFAQYNGVTYRINGKHTASILVADPLLLQRLGRMMIRWKTYKVNSFEEMGALYASIDTGPDKRSLKDVIHSYLATHKSLSQIPVATGCAAASGIGYATWGATYSRRPMEVRADLLGANVKFVWDLCTLLSEARQEERNAISRFAVVAAIYLAWQKTSKGTMAFWRQVRDGVGGTVVPQTTRLHDYLHTHRTGRASGNYESTSPEQLFRMSIHEWNNWRAKPKTSADFDPNNLNPVAE